MAYDWRTEWPGVFARHADSCPVREGHRCACGPLGYRASARDPETGRRVLSPDFQTVAEAREWLRDQQDTLEAARTVAREDGRLGALIDEFVAAAENGTARDRDGLEYLPSRVAELRESLTYVDAQLGMMLVEDVRRRQVQAMVDELHTSGVELEPIRHVVAALGLLYTYAIQREAVDFSPVVQLKLPDADEPPPAPERTDPLPSPALTQPLPTPPPAQTEPLPTPVLTQPVQAPSTNGSTNGFHYDPAMPPQPPVPAYATQAPPAQSTIWTPGSLSPPPGTDNYRDALMPERVLWWTVLIIVVVSVLIAIVLAAESV